MKKILFAVLLVSFSMAGYAKRAKIEIDHVEPTEWWSGMHNGVFQLMIHGTDVALCEVESPSMPIRRIERTGNNNYLFLYIDLAGVAPGEYDLNLTNGRKSHTIKYRINERKSGSARRKGFDSGDVVYLIMPDRFANGNVANDNVKGYSQGVVRGDLHQRQGGDIEGIIQHLDYIADMGYTAIWTTPVLDDNDNPYSYHHYSTTDFYKVDPRFGSNDDFRRLIDECHRYGLKYIFDIVPDHANPRHWWHNDLPDSSWYHNWPQFTRTNYQLPVAVDPHASEADYKQLVHGWFDVNMADLNLDNKLLFDYLLQSYIYWIEWAGIDGLRVDTYPYAGNSAMSHMMHAIRAEYPNMNIVSECWVKSVAEMAYYQSGVKNNNGFDSGVPTVMDFTLKDYFELAFNESEAWDKGMIRFYNHFAQDFALANPNLVMNFLDNHDMSRYSNAVNRDVRLYKMGLAMVALVRGFPQYYYGDEIMIDGRGNSYEDCRHTFPGGWAGDSINAFVASERTVEMNEIHGYLRSLLNYRKQSDALKYGKMKHFLPRDGVYVFFRYTDSEKVMVIVNNNEGEHTLDLRRFDEMDVVGNKGMDIITKEIMPLGDTLTLKGKAVTAIEILK